MFDIQLNVFEADDITKPVVSLAILRRRRLLTDITCIFLKPIIVVRLLLLLYRSNRLVIPQDAATLFFQAPVEVRVRFYLYSQRIFLPLLCDRHNTLIDLLNLQKLLNSAHGRAEFDYLPNEQGQVLDGVAQNVEYIEKHISDAEIKCLTQADVGGVAYSLQRRREEVQRRRNKHRIIKPLPINHQLLLPALLNLLSDSLRPRIQFYHLDVIYRFCRDTDSDILSLHIRLLQPCLPPGEPPVELEAQGED